MTPQTAASPLSATVTCSGAPGSPGRSTGKARLVRSFEDLTRLTTGDVLVCEAVSARWVSACPEIAGIVAERGGPLCSAAMAAREVHLPMVVAAVGAMRAIRDGQQVTVDGTRGIVLLA